MKRLRALLAIVLLLPAFSASSARAGALPVIVCFGDSITAGFGVDAGHSYPDSLQRELNARGYHYRVVNQGVSGNTTKDGIDRLPGVLALHPAVTIVEFGGNDGLRGLPIATTQKNLAAIVSALRRAGGKVILAGITLPPNYGADYIHQFDAIFPAVAAQYHVQLLPNLYAHVYNVPGAVQDDGIHPTAMGAQGIARNLLPLLIPLLHKG